MPAEKNGDWAIIGGYQQISTQPRSLVDPRNPEFNNTSPLRFNMLLDLPLELLQKCIHFAIFPHAELGTAGITHTPPTPESKKALQSLLLTCRALSSATFSYSFSSVTLSLGDIRARLHPHLPAPIIDAFARQLDASDALLAERKRSGEYHVAPCTVHTLRLVQDNRGQYNDNDIYTAALNTAFRNLAAVKVLAKYPSHDPGAAISACPLASLSCRYSIGLVVSQPRQWKLTSLSLWGIPVQHELLWPFLGLHAATLQELGLGFWRRYAKEDLMELPEMPCLRRAKLFASLAVDARIRGLQAVNISRLERVQREQTAVDRGLVENVVHVLGGARREVEVVYELGSSGTWDTHELGVDMARNRELVSVLAEKCASLMTVAFSGA